MSSCMPDHYFALTYPQINVQLSTAFGTTQPLSNRVEPNFLGEPDVIVLAKRGFVHTLDLIPKTEVSVGKDNVCQLFLRRFQESVI